MLSWVEKREREGEPCIFRHEITSSPPWLELVKRESRKHVKGLSDDGRHEWGDSTRDDDERRAWRKRQMMCRLDNKEKRSRKDDVVGRW